MLRSILIICLGKRNTVCCDLFLSMCNCLANVSFLQTYCVLQVQLINPRQLCNVKSKKSNNKKFVQTILGYNIYCRTVLTFSFVWLAVVFKS